MTNTELSLQTAIDLLLDENQDIDGGSLFPYTKFFSDLTSPQLKSLLKVWNEITLSRRHTLLAHLNKDLAIDLLHSFEVLGRALLQNEDVTTRTFAIRLLNDCENNNLVADFINIAEEDSALEPRVAAVASLGAYIYYGELEEEISSDNLKKIEEVLLHIAKHSEKTELRQRAVEALGYSSRKEVPALIEEAWQRGTATWKANAVSAMGRSYDQRWEEKILDSLSDENENVRLAATRAAGNTSLSSAREILLNALKEESDEDVLMATIWSLSEIGGEDVREYLLTLIDQYEDDEEEQIEYIEEALANLDFTEDVQDLILFDLDPEE